jgi:hypothetical protein
MERLRTAFRGRTPVPRAAVGRPEVAAADLVMTFRSPERSARRLQCVRLELASLWTNGERPAYAGSVERTAATKSVIAIGLWNTTETPSALAAFKRAVAARHGNDAHIRPYLVKARDES